MGMFSLFASLLIYAIALGVCIFWGVYWSNEKKYVRSAISFIAVFVTLALILERVIY